EPSLKRMRVSYTLDSTRIELMSVSCPGSMDVGSATSPTTSVLPAATAVEPLSPTSAAASDITTISHRHQALMASSPPCTDRTGMGRLPQTRVERVAKPVAHEVTTEDQDEDSEPRDGGHVGCHRNELAAVGEHRAPIGRRRLGAEPDEAESRALGDHDS